MIEGVDRVFTDNAIVDDRVDSLRKTGMARKFQHLISIIIRAEFFALRCLFMARAMSCLCCVGIMIELLCEIDRAPTQPYVHGHSGDREQQHECAHVSISG